MRTLLPALAVFVLAPPLVAQTTFFANNFNRSSVNTGGPTSYTINPTSGSSVSISSGVLQMGSSTSGRDSISASTSSYGTVGGVGYNPVLSGNTQIIVWSFNMRQSRSDPSGFDSGSAGQAVAIAGSSTTLTTGTGYAVVIGQSGTTDPIRLVSYSSGLSADSNLTNVAVATGSGADPGAAFLSVRVTYVPSSNTFSLATRDDFGSFADPQSGTYADVVSAVDGTYVGSSLSAFGLLWNHGAAGTDIARFDNFTVAPVPEPATLLAVAAAGLGGLRLRRRLARA